MFGALHFTFALFTFYAGIAGFCGGACSIGAMLPCKQRVAGASPVSSTILFWALCARKKCESKKLKVSDPETRFSEIFFLPSHLSIFSPAKPANVVRSK